MKILKSEELSGGQLAYNALDGLLTHEIFSVLQQEVPEEAKRIYAFEKKLLGPVLTMTRRGIRVDEKRRQEQIENIWPRIRRLTGMDVKYNKKGEKKWYVANKNALLQRLALAMWGKELNPNSGTQLKALFYDTMGIPPVMKSDKGVMKIKTDRDALEKLQKQYVKAKPFCSILLRFTDIKKKLELIEQPLLDGRFMYTFSPAGTETGRFNSKAHPFYIGHNIQNIDPELRDMFIPDEGFVFVSADLKGAESVAVAYLSGDEAYIRAVNSGDVHTLVASMVWGFEPLRELAERKFYLEWTYRDMAKRAGHGSSYDGKPPTIAREIKVEVDVVEDFQRKFFKAFPGIRDWHAATVKELQSTQSLVTPFGLRRIFWSRLWSDDTIREAIAFKPQSMIGYITHIGELRVWKELDGKDCQLLMNGHDSTLLQVKEDKLEILLPKIMKLLEVEVPVTDIKGIERKMTIPLECKIGYNWRDFDKKTGKNPEGLKDVQLI